jgi:hypothetical protein
MPPQERDRLLDFVNQCLRFRTHVIASPIIFRIFSGRDHSMRTLPPQPMKSSRSRSPSPPEPYMLSDTSHVNGERSGRGWSLFGFDGIETGFNACDAPRPRPDNRFPPIRETLSFLGRVSLTDNRFPLIRETLSFLGRVSLTDNRFPLIRETL